MVRSLALAVAATLALSACAATEERRPTPDGETSLLPDERLALPQYDVAQYRDLIQELRGRPVVVNFWGSWCPPCRAEAPEFREVSGEFEGRVQFLGVNFRDARGPARDFILEFDWQYPSIFDPEGRIITELGYVGWPVTVIYDREGQIAFEWVGAVNAELLRTEIRKVL